VSSIKAKSSVQVHREPFCCLKQSHSLGGLEEDPAEAAASDWPSSRARFGGGSWVVDEEGVVDFLGLPRFFASDGVVDEEAAGDETGGDGAGDAGGVDEEAGVDFLRLPRFVEGDGVVDEEAAGDQTGGDGAGDETGDDGAEVSLLGLPFLFAVGEEVDLGVEVTVTGVVKLSIVSDVGFSGAP